MLDALSKRGNDFRGKKKNNKISDGIGFLCRKRFKEFAIKIVYGFRKRKFYHFQRQQCETRMKTMKAFIESTFLSNFHNFAIIIIYIFATKILQFQNLSEFTVCWMKIYIHANITTLYIRTLTDQRFVIIYTENVC